jgi:FKBP-type peptidyl-prolyl cis-trans isomerase 2
VARVLALEYLIFRSQVRRGVFRMAKRNCLGITSIILLIVMLVAGCGGPQEAKTGDAVVVYYTGKLQDGTVFDSSEGGKPLEFTLGQGELIPGFEKAVLGMKVGESKTVTIPVDQAYGPHREDLIQVVPREQLPKELKPEIGMQLQSTRSDGSVLVVTVTEVSETTITVDANSPLAGKDLTFDIKLVGIGKSSSNESQGIDLASTSLGQSLSSGKPTLAEFGSNSCIPCKQMKPILEQLSVDYKDKLNVVIVEVYDQQALAQQYKVMAIPTQVVFDSSGKEVARHVGLWPREQIEVELSKLGIK